MMEFQSHSISPGITGISKDAYDKHAFRVFYFMAFHFCFVVADARRPY